MPLPFSCFRALVTKRNDLYFVIILAITYGILYNTRKRKEVLI